MAGCSGSEESESSSSESSAAESSSSESSASESSEAESSSSSSESTEATSGVKTVDTDEVNVVIEADDDSAVIIDVRKVEDYEMAHMPKAYNADMEKALDGNTEEGVEAMTKALEDATGSSTGGDKDIVLVSYSGDEYDQVGVDVLVSMGVSEDRIYTLEGGMEAWEKEFPDDVERA